MGFMRFANNLQGSKDTCLKNIQHLEKAGYDL